MPFVATVAGDVLQCKFDQCFGHLKNVIVIADDIMIVGKKPSHSNYDQAWTTLLETDRECNVQLNYKKLQYKKQEIDIFGETYSTSCCKLDQNKATAITKMPAATNKKQVQSFIGMINYLPNFLPDCWRLQLPSGWWKRTKYLSTGAQNINLLYTDEAGNYKHSCLGLLQS